MSEAIRDFLTTVYGPALALDESPYLMLWSIPGKKSTWHTALDTAVADALARLQQHEDVYVGVGLTTRPYPTTRRAPANEIMGIPGLWADIDLAHPLHKKGALPATAEEAAEIISRRLGPTLIVHTGHGLHAWWLFDEPWLFDDDAERVQAQTLSTRWQHTLAADLKDHGYTMDATHDLARVLRVAGTVNYKDDHYEQVEIYRLSDDLRHSPSDFESYLLDEELRVPVVQGTTVLAADLVLDPNASPPFDEFNLLMDINRKFVLSWNRKRPDLKDPSPSGYDMSLAVLAVEAGWTDQQIVNLLISHRRRFGADNLRLDYYRTTLAKARSGRASPEQINDDKEFANALFSKIAESGGKYTATDEERERALGVLRGVLGIPLVRVIKYVAANGSSTGAEYRFEAFDGDGFSVGNAEDMANQRKLGATIMQNWNRVIPAFKADAWRDNVVRWLPVAQTEIRLQHEASEAGQMETWVTDYLAKRNAPLPNVEAAEATKYPFYAKGDGAICFFSGDFLEWLKDGPGVTLSAVAMGRRLHEIGIDSHTESIKLGGSHGGAKPIHGTRGVWKIPLSWDVEGAYAEAALLTGEADGP